MTYGGGGGDSAEKEEKKRPVAHEMAVELLEEYSDQFATVAVLATMYARGTVVPAEGIPELIQAFEEALSKGPFAIAVRPAIEALNEQLEEAKKKEEEKTEG